MSQPLHVTIEGDRSEFKSKTSIKRFKNDIKKLEDFNSKLDLTKYFKEGFDYQLTREDNKINISIFEDPKIKKQRELREKLKQFRNMRTGKMRRDVFGMKKDIPKKIFKAYLELKRTFDIPVPDPRELINNSEKHINMIKMYGSGMELTKDPKMNSLLYKYYGAVANHLNIETIDPYTMDRNHMEKIKRSIDRIEKINKPTLETNMNQKTESESDSE